MTNEQKGDDTKWDKKHLLPKELLWANNDGRRESPQLSETKKCLKLKFFSLIIMEDGGLDTTVIDSWQHKMGQMADFPPLLGSSVFDL